MRNIKSIIVCLLITLPIIKVNALSCLSSEIDITKVDNFSCSEITGNTLKFYDNTTNDDYTNYFTYTINNNSAQITIDKNIKFDSSFPNRFIKVEDDNSSAVINIKNTAYKTTTTTTTTTKDANTKEIVVTLDPNNGSSKTTLSCKILSGSTTCTVNLPKLETENFAGWGTAKTCKEGNTGTNRVEKDITYYACYKDNTKKNTSLTLESLELYDKDTEEKIDFGTFSRKKTQYEFKVLNEVKNIEVKTKTSDDIKVEVSGNENLVEGTNEIVIKLTNENNETNEYKLTATRLKKGEKINSIHYLKSLVIGGYTIDFNKEIFNYNLTISSDINSLEITVITENKSDKYEIVNNKDLKDGSVIQIKVTGDDDEETVYKINITKEKSNLIFYVLIGIVAFLIILLIVFIIIIKTKKKKMNKTQDNNNVEILNI